MLWGITIRFQKLSLSQRQVAHVLLTRPPLRILIKNQNSPFDLHVLSVPPAFVLSQDQTLYYSCISIALPNALKSILLHNACVITFRVYFFSVCTWLLVSFKSSFKGISRVVTFSCIVRFSRCCSLTPSFGAALLLYHSFLNLSSTFFKFFQIFSLLAVAPLSCNFYIISHCLPFVKLFLNLFSKFFPSAFRLCSFKRFPCAQIFLTYFVSRLSSRPTALLLYHLFCTLSTKRF